MADDLSKAERLSVTAALTDRLAAMDLADLTPEAITVAKQCLMDWIGVALGGSSQDLVKILKDVVLDGRNTGPCGIVGTGEQASEADAVLINGTMGHALDFDDVIHGLGHPTVPVAPVVLALAQSRGLSGMEVIAAFVAGVDTEVRVGHLLGPSHYAKGWHSTATAGTFGAMAAAARILKLDAGQIQHGFGLAGAQAAGLKSMFGTMTKPLHAGKAAQNGLLAAKLAGAGFTSDTEVLDSEQGFVDTQSSSADPVAALKELPQRWHVVDAMFKYHAACYLTHNAIEASNKLRLEHGITPEQVEAVLIQFQPRAMGVCNIQEPRSGLECKFSVRMTAAMALFGENTSDDDLFSDETANREDLVALRRRVTVQDDGPDAGSVVTITLKDGRKVAETVNVALPSRDLEGQQAKLEAKFHSIVDRILGPERAQQIVDEIRALETRKDLSSLFSLIGA